MRKATGRLEKKQYNARTNKALCHLLILTGYNSNTNFKGHNECFINEMNIIASVKVKLIRLTGLTQKVAKQNSSHMTHHCPLDYGCNKQDEDISLAEGISLLVEEDSALPVEEAKAEKEEVEVVESVMLTKLSRDNYNAMSKAINTSYNKDGKKDTKFWSYHGLKKSSLLCMNSNALTILLTRLLITTTLQIIM